MYTVVPSYYAAFSCKADRCRHSCCIGWEIEIDSTTAARYRLETGTLGARLQAAIVEDDDGCRFALDEQERCPFLNAQGLCDIILARGEEALCDICALHPRFRYDYSDRTEWGLGLCCEAAATLILSQEHATSFSDGRLPLPDDPDEAALLRLRRRAVGIAQDRSRSVADREEALLALAARTVPDDAHVLATWYTPLERLDPAWDKALGRLTQPAQAPVTVPDTAWEQLLVYFLYRQLPPALEDGRPHERLAFAVLSARLIRRLTAAFDGTFDTFTELCRLYSSEIEYDDGNVMRLLSRLSRDASPS